MDRFSPVVELHGHQIPARCFVGDFELLLDEITAGGFDQSEGTFREVAGTAWLRLPCARPPIFGPVLKHRDLLRPVYDLEVVDDVWYPQTQVSLADALRFRPDAKVGDTVSISLDVDRAGLSDIIARGAGVPDWLGADPRAAGFAVKFRNATISVRDASSKGRLAAARIIEGEVVYPGPGAFGRPIEITIAGFTLSISSMRLSHGGATAVASVALPGGLTDVDSCRQASLDLGVITMSPRCEFYVEAPERPYGPWLLADTGLVIEGVGYVLDLSATASPAPRPSGWKGLRLGAGMATGEKTVPNPCNTGYLRGHYTYDHATLLSSGFFGFIHLSEPVQFDALNPFGQSFSFNDGEMDIRNSKFLCGELRNGWTDLPSDAVCEGEPGNRVRTPIASVCVQPNLDLSGWIDHGNREISWGELTQHGDEVVAWSGIFDRGYLYLPAGPQASYCPLSPSEDVFSGPSIVSDMDAILVELEAHHVAGVRFPASSNLLVYSPDRPRGRKNPIKIEHLHGWIRVGINGVDGEVRTHMPLPDVELGDPKSVGYEGNLPFVSTLFVGDTRCLLAQFVSSAAFESEVPGSFTIPAPCEIDSLAFTGMRLTSTACFVGGNLNLGSGVPLQHWSLRLVPTGSPVPAGVVSVRTGRVLLTAAGIEEPVHFARPFGLTWGEMLANGDIGTLILDFNNWGQRFDGLNFNPHELALSKYDPSAPDPYLGVSGPIHLPFFGLHAVNIRDAADLRAGTPAPRHVTVPKGRITPHAPLTALALSATWHDVNADPLHPLAQFDCSEDCVDYDVEAQKGFVGKGSGRLSFLGKLDALGEHVVPEPPLDIEVKIRSDATDIGFSSRITYDLDLTFAQLGGMDQIAGQARIEGPTLRCITFQGKLARGLASNCILAPSGNTNAQIEICVTPTTFDFRANGECMLMLVSKALVKLGGSAKAHLLFDFAVGSASGELDGRVYCDALVAGLQGEGQLTWYVAEDMQYLQGRQKVVVIGKIAGGELEGGFFIGQGAPRERVWVLEPPNKHFVDPKKVLPDYLTGVYGYGQASVSIDLVSLFAGGVEVYVGAGAFAEVIPSSDSLTIAIIDTLFGPLPHVLGVCGIDVHGEILGGLFSASALAVLGMSGAPPSFWFDGRLRLEGCFALGGCEHVDLKASLRSGGLDLELQ